jgi:iron(III) transport system substrate-binding protein
MRPPARRAFISNRTLLTLGVIAVAFLTLWRLTHLRGNALVVYCAHDAVFAESVLRDFEKQSGIRLAVRYDTEATKSLGLVEQIIREGNRPRCDVFWNNELLGTMDLAERGLLAPYRGPGWERIPPQWKDTEGKWAGFAARMRVLILNTRNLDASGVETSGGVFNSGLATPDLNRTAIAKPLYGTTLTHYTVLWQRWGGERLRAWHRETRQRGLREVNGNGAVKQIVAQGACDQGFTDTDDFFDARDAEAPVAMLPVQLEAGETICIPNTVALIRGSHRETEAQRLVDFLLSAETELALARSKSRQIPLGAIEEAQLPPEVKDLRAWSAKAVPLTGLLKAREECLAWLKQEYAK